MARWNRYHLAKNLEEALTILATAPGTSRLVAGGTDLLLDIQQDRQAPVDTLVDVTEIPDLTCLEIRNGRLFIGAAVPLNRVVASELVRQNAAAVYEACSLIGGPQVRNTATLGGNVAHALPAGDGTISLLAHDAIVEIASLNGHRNTPIETLFAGPGRSTLDPKGEILVGFSLALRQPGQASAFKRVMRPQGVAIAILNMAAWLERRDDQISQVRLAVGPASPTPFRAHRTEEALTGQLLTSETIENARQVLVNEATLRTSPHRATAEYRRRLAGILLEETLSIAWERASKLR